MKEHHIAWLRAHPERDEFWLQSALENGFDVHHLDGDHGNNDPGNLVLIEHSDHMKLHGVENSALLRGKPNWVSAEDRRTKCQQAYEMKAADPTNVSWRLVADRLGFPSPNYAVQYAKYWARADPSREWPLPSRKYRGCAVEGCHLPVRAGNSYCLQHLDQGL